MKMCLQGPNVKQFMDVFSLPEMTLLAVANEYFISNDIEYDPVHLYKDISVSFLLIPQTFGSEMKVVNRVRRNLHQHTNTCQHSDCRQYQQHI